MSVLYDLQMPTPRRFQQFGPRFRKRDIEAAFSRVVMGPRPTEGDEKRLGPATTLCRTVALSFVIPTGATCPGLPWKRRGGICGSTDPSCESFSTERS